MKDMGKTQKHSHINTLALGFPQYIYSPQPLIWIKIMWSFIGLCVMCVFMCLPGPTFLGLYTRLIKCYVLCSCLSLKQVPTSLNILHEILFDVKPNLNLYTH